MMGAASHNTWRLFVVMLRREALRLTMWLVGIVGFGISVALAYPLLFDQDMERRAMGETMNNPAMIAMMGKPYGIDNYDIGAMYANQMLIFMIIATAIMSIFLVIRHTRNDEEKGVMELVKSLPIGRIAPVNSALTLLIVANGIIAILFTAMFLIMPVQDIGALDAFHFSFIMATGGIVFGSITLVFVQLFENTRTSILYGFIVLIGFYLIRAVGDVADNGLTWLSPLGWLLKSESMVNNYLWPLMLSLFLALLMSILALTLHNIRDFGTGFFKGKPGRKNASKWLRSPVGLTLKLQRVTIIAWMVGLFILGLSYGAIFGDLETFLAQNSTIGDIIPENLKGTLEEQFLSVIMQVIGNIATIGPLTVLFRIIGEEKEGRTEALYSTTLSRRTYLTAHLKISIMLGIFLSALGGLGAYAGIAASMDTPIKFMHVMGASLIFLPAIIFMIGLGVLMVGLGVGTSTVAWLYLIYGFVAVYFGTLLDFPQIFERLTPFGYVPSAPVESFAFLPATLTLVLAISVMALGYHRYVSRDLNG